MNLTQTDAHVLQNQQPPVHRLQTGRGVASVADGSALSYRGLSTLFTPVCVAPYANVPKRADGHAISGAGAEDTPAHFGQLVDVAAVHNNHSGISSPIFCGQTDKQVAAGTDRLTLTQP